MKTTLFLLLCATFLLNAAEKQVRWEPTGKSRLIISKDAATLCSLSFKGAFRNSWGFPFREIPGKPFTVEDNGKTITAKREYQLPNAKIAQFTVTIERQSENKLLVKWDPGISDAQAAAIPNFSLNPEIMLQGKYRSVPLMIDGRKIIYPATVPAKRENTLIEAGSMKQIILHPDDPAKKIVFNFPDSFGTFTEQNESAIIVRDWPASNSKEITIEW